MTAQNPEQTPEKSYYLKPSPISCLCCGFECLHHVMSRCIFPEGQQKRADFQKVDPDKMERYRPNSMVSIFAKVFESLMQTQINNRIFYDSNIFMLQWIHFLNINVWLYISNRTTSVTVVLRLFWRSFGNFWGGIDAFCGTLFGRLKQCFDCVSHDQQLLDKQSGGVGGVAFQILKS